jgi:rhamnose utilization protein RhaD (predicted bifunctional aldolase and dehydrogenase)
MTNPFDPIATLVELSRWIGAPEQDCAILGEGNASIAVGDGTFYVKASGAELRSLAPEGLVRIDLQRMLTAVVSPPNGGDAAVRVALENCVVESDGTRRPSVEAPLHAVCLAQSGVSVVGHCHPTAVNALTCSNDFERALAGRLFPDEIVVCGAESLLVPYVDPGIPLAQEVARRLQGFVARAGVPPKTIYLQNHGFVALGKSATDIRAITAMAIKAARIRLGAAAFGGFRTLDDHATQRIDSRPDEHFRRAALGNM